MPFPYSYYQTYYNGPVNALSLNAKALSLSTNVSQLSTSGSVDVTDMSHVSINTTAGDVVIDNFINPKDGQVLFIHKDNSNNRVVFKYNTGTEGRIFSANKQDIVWGHGSYGGAVFICKDAGGVKNWYHLDSNGLFGDGLEALPAMTFASDPDTGMYKVADNIIGISTSGVNRFAIETTKIKSLLSHLFIDGSAAAPSISFTSDPDTGFYKDATRITFTSDGVDRLAFDKSGNLQSSSAMALTAFDGTTLQRLRLGSLLSSNVAADNSLVPVNGIYSKGNIKTAGLFEGTATSARFADLAERYRADKEYGPGTLISIGGSEEITETVGFADTEVFGIISTNPAYGMNSVVPEGEDEKLWPYVALAGRVPCRVIGKIKKGERIIPSSQPGLGQGLSSAMISIRPADLPYIIVGRSLNAKDTDGEGIIEIAIGGLK